MASLTYSFFVTNSGTAATGLTPSFSMYKDLVTGTTLSPAPTISEVASGHYKFSVDWTTSPHSTAPTTSVVFLIDNGASLSSASDRYLGGRINKSDDYGQRIDTIYEVTLGKWEVVSDQLKLYKTDGTTLVATFDLFDQVGSPTSTLPARREPL